MSITAPYGTWPSPITPGTITTRTVSLSQVRVDGPDTYWVERRASQNGRQVLLRRAGDGSIGELLPLTPADELVDVRTRVHEYGGRAYAVDGGIIVVSHGGDDRLYRYDVSHRLRGLVPLTIYGDVRHGDLEIDTERGVVYAVREDHRGEGEAVNTLVAIPLDGSAARDDSAVRTLVSGTDFVSSPTLSPDGQHLAWLTWNHPNMPWTATQLHVGDLLEDGALGEQLVLAGMDADESVAEPRWTEECELIHVSNLAGFRNLYRTEGFPRRGTSGPGWSQHLRTRPLHPAQATFSTPAWELGPHTYDVLDGDHLIASWARNGVWHLGAIRLANGELEEWNVGWQPLGNVAASDGRVVMLANNELALPSIVEIKHGQVEVLRDSGSFEPDPNSVSLPTPLSWPTADGATAHGFLYPPTSATHAAPEGELPPLIVNVHGGPTSACRTGYDLCIQYWTTRGFAYLDVNYRGSTGLGTDYRLALNGNWGVVDVEDCASGAKYLAEQGLVDPDRMAIQGSSSGGFTVLSALVQSEVFSAGISRYGIADLTLLAQTTHKFESRYLESLLGVSSAQDPTLSERSPINHIDQIHSPLLLLQGSEDPVVPKEQATLMYNAVKDKGLPVALQVYQGEGHGFRLAANIRRALQAQHSFFAQVWHLPVEEEFEPIPVENLA